MADSEEDVLDPATIGSEGPPIAEKPYKIVFEANLCIGAGKCAEVSGNWELDITTGIAKPRSYFVGEEALAENVAAVEKCPAKKGDGVIHVIDRETGEEIAPDPHGDGTVSVDW
jgi:ferredoxin